MEFCISQEFEKQLEPYFQENTGDLGKYKIISELGRGTYGIVYHGRHIESKRDFAIKRIKAEDGNEGVPVSAIYEINLLNLCKHPNIIRMTEICRGKIWPTFPTSFCLVFELCVFSLNELIFDKTVSFSLGQIKHIMQQLLQGVNYLHANQIMHRDLKPSNILLTKEGQVKIADLGVAVMTRSVLAANVVTPLWYQAPELFFTEQKFTTAIDMWSVGCIMAELLMRRVLFKGDYVTQLAWIIAICGPITPQLWPGIEKQSLWKWYHFYIGQSSKLEAIIQQHEKDPLVYDLMEKFLTYDPAKRITAENALRHEFFFASPEPSDLTALVQNVKQSC